MYGNHFGLREVPFSIAPDPRYLFMSDAHREALAHLRYGIESEGCFVLLTGEVGTGKTTLCRCLLQQLPENCDVALIFNPKLSAEELLATICKEFGIRLPRRRSINEYVDRINDYLLEANAVGRRALLIIDEAQNLTVDVLEQMRLLTNLETSSRKLLQIVLLGQPELREIVARPALRQLAQRITARYHLSPLARRDVAAYVGHRLAVSGASCRIFAPAAIASLRRHSCGIPRLINMLCDRALLGAYTEGEKRVSKRVLEKAAREVLGPARNSLRQLSRYLAVSLVSVISAAAIYFHASSLPDFSSALAASRAAVARIMSDRRQAPSGIDHSGRPVRAAPVASE